MQIISFEIKSANLPQIQPRATLPIKNKSEPRVQEAQYLGRVLHDIE